MKILYMNLNIGKNDENVKRMKTEVIRTVISRYGEEERGNIEIESFSYRLRKGIRLKGHYEDLTLAELQQGFLSAKIRRAVHEAQTILIFNCLGDIAENRSTAVNTLDYWAYNKNVVDIYLADISLSPLKDYNEELVKVFHQKRYGSIRRGRAPEYPKAFKEYVRKLNNEGVSMISVAEAMDMKRTSLFSIAYSSNDAARNYNRGREINEEELDHLTALLLGGGQNPYAEIYDDGITL